LKKSIVSLSLTDYYCASIAPGCAALLRMRRGWRPVVVQKSCANGATKQAASPWLAELSLLESLLGEVQHGLPLNITLSNHYVRYRLIPAPPFAMPADGVQALMKHCFRDTYGDVVNDWKIRANLMPGQGDVVACAVDKALIEGLKAMADKASFRLGSVQPYFMPGFNADCRRFNGEAVCFVQAEPGRIILGTLCDRNWLGLRAVATTPGWKEELPAHIEREILLAGWNNACPVVYLHTPEGAQEIKPEETKRWKLEHVSQRQIQGYSPEQDFPYAMALSGVR
jgi:hypothetical protein